ncbi:NADP-dependent 3-hydroxy acid dehydrogenase (L-allo-threonine dehydrogenase) [Durusdinium trenchii]|uniref:NADP-dependent 3-hydroxy acid dehydrogenase (L-allo-threonine dehydrogenase) n=1 Tax=Durusdinium trenchii TaxID=1381693 RepID=A0ABP0KCE4_9DINO
MESAWQPSEELWLLARTKLVAKDFMPPSDVRAVESTRKLQEDWERRKPVMVQACPWQRHLATENRSQSTQRHLEADLRSKIIHPSIQPLVKQILNSLSSKAPDDVDIWHMSALRAAASTAHGAGSFLLGLVLKASRDEDQLLAEMEKLQKVQSSLGPLRSPRVLSAKHTEDGLFAFAQEFLLCSRYFEAGQRERQSSSFADLLRIGARPLALEDAGRDMEDLHARLGMSAEDLAAVSLEELRHAAQQTGELLGRIGEATAWRFAELHCHLALCGRRTDRLEALKKALCDRFAALPEPIITTLDVQDTEKIRKLPEQLKAAGMPAVDILVNNAGLALGVASAIENELENIQTMLATNVQAVMCLVSTFGPQMKERGRGHIVNISSVAGHECYVGGSAYCATKHAVNAILGSVRRGCDPRPSVLIRLHWMLHGPHLIRTDLPVSHSTWILDSCTLAALRDIKGFCGKAW